MKRGSSGGNLFGYAVLTFTLTRLKGKFIRRGTARRARVPVAPFYFYSAIDYRKGGRRHHRRALCPACVLRFKVERLKAVRESGVDSM